MDWVERGSAPYKLVASNASTAVSRPVYPYPTVARYSGSGSTSEAANFVPYTLRRESDVSTRFLGDYLYSAR